MTIYMLSEQDNIGWFRVYAYPTAEMRDAAKASSQFPELMEPFEIQMCDEPVADWKKGGPGD